MTDGELMGALVAAISALYAALHLSMRQRIEDWRGLYEAERKAHQETRTMVLDQLREQNEILADLVNVLPKRRGDWEVRP